MRCALTGRIKGSDLTQSAFLLFCSGAAYDLRRFWHTAPITNVPHRASSRHDETSGIARMIVQHRQNEQRSSVGGRRIGLAELGSKIQATCEIWPASLPMGPMAYGGGGAT